MSGEDFSDSLRIQMGGITPSLTPRHTLALMKVVPANSRPVTRLVGVIIHAARQRAEVRVESAAGRQAITLVEAQVPFAHHVRGISRLLQPLRQCPEVKGQTAGLPRADYRVLETRMDLISKAERERKITGSEHTNTSHHKHRHGLID